MFRMWHKVLLILRQETFIPMLKWAHTFLPNAMRWKPPSKSEVNCLVRSCPDTGDEIFDYIAEDNPEAAIDLDTSFEVAVERLRDFPLSGRTVKWKEQGSWLSPPITSLFTRYPIRLLILSQFVMRRQMNEGSSAKSVLCFMDSHYSKFEKLNIPITIRHSFEYLDFIVCSFSKSDRKSVV